MLEQLAPLRPPTDNLYKFLALFGLVFCLAAGWAHLRVDFDIIRAIQEYDRISDAIDRADDRYIATEVRKLRAERRTGKVDADTYATRLDKIYETEPPKNAQLEKRLADAKLRLQQLPKNDDPERITYAIAAGIGIILMLVGFWLWYVRVQRPLDKIMQADLKERQASKQIDST